MGWLHQQTFASMHGACAKHSEMACPTRWQLRDAAVTWFYSLCRSCSTRTWGGGGVLGFLGGGGADVAISLFLPAPAPLAAELCHPHVLAAGRCGQPSDPASASGYHSPEHGLQAVPDGHSTTLSLQKMCLALTDFEILPFLTLPPQFIFAFTRTQGLPFFFLFQFPLV